MLWAQTASSFQTDLQISRLEFFETDFQPVWVSKNKMEAVGGLNTLDLPRGWDASWFVQQPLSFIGSFDNNGNPCLALFWSSLECWSLGSKTRCESAEVSKVAVEDLCCLLFVFPTSALPKRKENVALGTAAQLRWTAARTEKRKASLRRGRQENGTQHH